MWRRRASPLLQQMLQQLGWLILYGSLLLTWGTQAQRQRQRPRPRLRYNAVYVQTSRARICCCCTPQERFETWPGSLRFPVCVLSRSRISSWTFLARSLLKSSCNSASLLSRYGQDSWHHTLVQNLTFSATLGWRPYSKSWVLCNREKMPTPSPQKQLPRRCPNP